MNHAFFPGGRHGLPARCEVALSPRTKYVRQAIEPPRVSSGCRAVPTERMPPPKRNCSAASAADKSQSKEKRSERQGSISEAQPACRKASPTLGLRFCPHLPLGPVPWAAQRRRATTSLPDLGRAHGCAPPHVPPSVVAAMGQATAVGGVASRWRPVASGAGFGIMGRLAWRVDSDCGRVRPDGAGPRG